MCVNILKQLRFNTDESLFGMFDGGHNSNVPQLIVKRMPDVLRDAMMHHDSPSDFMKYAMLAMHRSVPPSFNRITIMYGPQTQTRVPSYEVAPIALAKRTQQTTKVCHVVTYVHKSFNQSEYF